MKRFFAILGTAILLVACAQAPAPRTIVDSWETAQNPGDVFTAALEVLTEMKIDVDKVEKDAGLIQTQQFDLLGNGNEFCDCGKLGMSGTEKGRRGSLTILVKQKGNATAVKVAARFEILFTDLVLGSRNDLWKRPCQSTGKLEADLWNQVQAKLK